jgi:hypothetical protein
VLFVKPVRESDVPVTLSCLTRVEKSGTGDTSTKYFDAPADVLQVRRGFVETFEAVSFGDVNTGVDGMAITVTNEDAVENGLEPSLFDALTRQ